MQTAVPGAYTHAASRTNPNENLALTGGPESDNDPRTGTLTPGFAIDQIAAQSTQIYSSIPGYAGGNLNGFSNAELFGPAGSGALKPVLLFYPNVVKDYKILDSSVDPPVYRAVTEPEEQLDWRHPTQHPGSISGNCETAVAGSKGQDTFANLLNGIEGGALIISLEARIGAGSAGSVEVYRASRTPSPNGCDQGGIIEKEINNIPAIQGSTANNAPDKTKAIAASVAWTREA
jgi:hypothetical protein